MDGESYFRGVVDIDVGDYEIELIEGDTLLIDGKEVAIGPCIFTMHVT